MLIEANTLPLSHTANKYIELTGDYVEK